MAWLMLPSAYTVLNVFFDQSQKIVICPSKIAWDTSGNQSHFEADGVYELNEVQQNIQYSSRIMHTGHMWLCFVVVR